MLNAINALRASSIAFFMLPVVVLHPKSLSVPWHNKTRYITKRCILFSTFSTFASECIKGCTQYIRKVACAQHRPLHYHEALPTYLPTYQPFT